MLTEAGYIFEPGENIRFIGEPTGTIYTITHTITSEDASRLAEYVAVERGKEGDQYTVYFSDKSDFVKVTY